MKSMFWSAAAAAALFAMSATAAEPAAPAEPATAKTAAEEQVCTVEKQLGSNMKKRVCRTRAQYEAEQVNARGAMDRMKQRSEQTRDGF